MIPLNKKIAIAGLGWLGLPLYQHFETLGYSIKGSVTSHSKANTLQQIGVDAYALKIKHWSGLCTKDVSFFTCHRSFKC